MSAVSRWVVLSALALFCGPAWASDSLPNIVVILADDLGWKDVGYHGSEIETPHIDRIAREGIELDRFYVQPTCSPTRSGLMTGKSPMRLGINQPLGKNDAMGLPLDETILPEYLARQGYQSVMAGKWHLGNFTPNHFPHARGFESFYGYLNGGIGYWNHNHGGGHDWQRNGVTLREEGYATRLLTDEAVRLLRTRDRDRPTFLYLAYGAPHLPNEAPEETVARYAAIERPARRLHAGMVSELDAGIGRVLDTLAAQGMLENTIILFSSDNGGLVRDALPAPLLKFSDIFLRVFDRPIPFLGLEFLVSNTVDGASDNTPLREGKGSVHEGGARVPAAIWWPGQLEGRRHKAFMTISDVLPTLLEAIGAEHSIPSDLDGRSQWSALAGQGEATTADYMISGSPFGEALYRAPWKLILGDDSALYNVFADPLETKNVAESHPEIVRAMLETASGWPRREREATTIFGLIMDPDTFGGAEDRAPWADVATERAQAKPN